MIIGNRDYVDRSIRPSAAWAEIWHLWTIVIPRRSITGRLVCAFRGIVSTDFTAS